jgi:hypothetical protein
MELKAKREKQNDLTSFTHDEMSSDGYNINIDTKKIPFLIPFENTNVSYGRTKV